MNQSLLKSFAPEARNRFRATMEQRAALLGLSADKEPVTAQKSGDKIYIGGKAFPAAWEDQRKKLAERIARQGWNAVMEEAAYTWFNRFAALRYMEVHGYTPQGIRVLTPTPQGSQPEILERAAGINLPGLKKEDILELKLDGQRDEELYRLLVLALCESFHSQLPLLFPAVQEDLELLLPDMLLRSDSLLSWFVQGMPDGEWQEIEVLGWLYQYYISELKSEYMARKTAYKKEEIPAVTQLFTPKWIVQYLVHNSLGRTWLLHYPESALKTKMPYYIEPAQQEPEVEAELKQLFSGSLNPEDIKLLDPAMGSGHILVTAYDVLREIYLERGYQRQQCARLILEKNLYGLDIDLRASEIACFALIMKAREDDPGILETGKGLRLNLLSFRDCSPVEWADLIQSLNPAKDQRENMKAVLSLFEQGTLFGSLIEIPEHLVGKLGDLALWLENVATGQDLLASKAAESALVFVRLAQVLGLKYDQVVSNPPYMGNKFLSPALKAFLGKKYEGYEKDLFSAFIVRNLLFSKVGGQLGFMSPFVWMFISSYEELRSKLIDDEVITSLIQLEYSGFDGATVPICTFTLQRSKVRNYKGVFIRLSDFRGAQNQAPKALEAIRDHNCGWFFSVQPDEFRKIPGRPIAYWVSEKITSLFSNCSYIEKAVKIREGINTGDNDLFLRFWHEVQSGNSGMYNSVENPRWLPHRKGGPFRRWYGNNDYVLNWKNRGIDIHRYHNLPLDYNGAPVRGKKYFGLECLSWSRISSGDFAIRYYGSGMTYDSTAPSIFGSSAELSFLISFLNSKVVSILLKAMSPTLDYRITSLGRLPIRESNTGKLVVNSNNLILRSKSDWDAFETSWDFESLPWLPKTLPTYLNDTTISAPDQHSIASCWDTWRAIGQHWTAEMLRLEEENNRLFIDAYGLQDELTPEVPIEQITLTVNPWYRYKPRKSKPEVTEDDGPGNEEPGAAGTAVGPQIYPEGEARMRADGARELVSYALGCAMGRYSLDEGGLVYAEAGGAGFDGERYRSYPADDDGIVPVTDFKWFEEDAAVRVEDLVRTVWGSEQHEQNMAWLAEALEAKGTELPLDTLRRYLAGDFYKDHLQTSKKRPIYWKFSSGKEKAFEALVYLHRYHAGSLSRMRMQYVVPLTGQLRKKIDSLDAQIREAASTAERKRLEKEQATLQKKLAELAKFDEELNHYAQLQISLDLDDGVRVNYGKFGGLLANVKDVCGKGEE
ncbi:MAG TPA: BREX-1 system adenine-specific DNA-methyltransferase PglX [bacterium]|nr:BREX-1 system adenine-specific DNA-methyltransferase PglX [bacterium]